MYHSSWAKTIQSNREISCLTSFWVMLGVGLPRMTESLMTSCRLLKGGSYRLGPLDCGGVFVRIQFSLTFIDLPTRMLHIKFSS